MGFMLKVFVISSPRVYTSQRIILFEKKILFCIWKCLEASQDQVDQLGRIWPCEGYSSHRKCYIKDGNSTYCAHIKHKHLGFGLQLGRCVKVLGKQGKG